jgi:hypothetical protein
MFTISQYLQKKKDYGLQQNCAVSLSSSLFTGKEKAVDTSAEESFETGRELRLENLIYLSTTDDLIASVKS